MATKERRQEFIDTYNRYSLMNTLKDGCVVGTEKDAGVKFSYSYNSKYDLLILHSYKTKKESNRLTIPAVFDATLPFFSSDLEYLNLNNVKYIIERRKGFNDLSNLKEVRGRKLRLSHMVNLETGDICTISRALTYELRFLAVGWLYSDIYMLRNDLFNNIGSRTKVLLPALKFHMAEHMIYRDYHYYFDFMNDYSYFNKIRRGQIGYKSVQEYEERSRYLKKWKDRMAYN